MPESTLRVGKPLGGSLEIHIECKQLANMDTFSLSDPFALVQIKTGDEWTEVGRTETIWDDLNPKWVRSFTLSSDTRSDAKLRVTVYDRDARSQDLDKQQEIGFAVCEVWELLDEGSNGRTLPLEGAELKKEKGAVTLIGELFDDALPCHELILGKCKFKNTKLFGKLATKNAYITIYRRRANNEWAPVFRSCVKREDSSDSHPARLRTGDATPLRFELRSHRSAHEHRLIGAVHISLASLRRHGAGKTIPLGLTGETVGELHITNSVLDSTSSKFDLEVAFST